MQEDVGLQGCISEKCEGRQAYCVKLYVCLYSLLGLV